MYVQQNFTHRHTHTCVHMHSLQVCSESVNIHIDTFTNKTQKHTFIGRHCQTCMHVQPGLYIRTTSTVCTCACRSTVQMNTERPILTMHRSKHKSINLHDTYIRTCTRRYIHFNAQLLLKHYAFTHTVYVCICSKWSTLLRYINWSRL